MSNSVKFAPGEVSANELARLRQQFEASEAADRVALNVYNAAYRRWCEARTAKQAAETEYTWALRGMVKVNE